MAYTFLIVDDSTTTRDVIARTLGMAGVEIAALHQAANGKDGLDILRGHWVDLVFLDINMPVMSGIEMIERMKEDPVLSRVPVVVVSTDGSASRVEQLSAKGVRAYLRKPFTPEKLREVVEQVLAGGRQ
jgi:two-component system, chemotaxis family, chemotaxis protein CheY